MGTLGSRPLAVSTASGAISVFWRGTNRSQLWGAEFIPGHGWRGAQRLASGLASDPAPAVSGTGQISVFWKGADGRLWHTSGLPGHPWKAPAALSVGALGTGPRATGQSNGEIQVFWGGVSGTSIWHAAYTRAGGWSRPSRIGYGSESYLVATAPDTESAFWTGSDHKLRHAMSQQGTGWHAPSTVPVGKVGGHVFAAGQRNGVVDVFWRGVRDPHLWHARYRPGGAWSGPDNLGGKLG